MTARTALLYAGFALTAAIAVIGPPSFLVKRDGPPPDQKRAPVIDDRFRAPAAPDKSADHLRITGHCEYGGFIEVATPAKEATLPNELPPPCTVTVYESGSMKTALLYDSAGQPARNPFQADDGRWSFHARTGRYDVYFKVNRPRLIPKPSSQSALPAPQVNGALTTLTFRQFTGGTRVAKDLGASCDGSSDDTVTLQNAVDSLLAWSILDGQGCTAAVTSLHLKSQMALRNFYLTAVAGATNLRSPVTLDGRVSRGHSAKANVLISNVHVNGNRGKQTGILTPGEEDGGRHCFRMIGRITNLRIEHSSGTYCATDGLLVGGYHEGTSDLPAGLPIQNVAVVNSDFSYNRRQGVALEGANNASLIGVSLTNNGTTLEGAKDATEGNFCAHLGAPEFRCFGTGFWMENDGGTASSGASHFVSLIDCVMKSNYSRSAYFFAIGNPSAPEWRPRSHIRFVNCEMDAGQFPVPGSELALQFQVPDRTAGNGVAYEDVSVIDSSIRGTIALRGVVNFQWIGGSVENGAGALGFAEFTDRLLITDVRRGSLRMQSTGNQRPDGTVGQRIRYMEDLNIQQASRARRGVNRSLFLQR